MVRRLLALALLVNVLAVVPNLPRILAAVDGEAVGTVVGEWSIGISRAGGDLVEDIAAGAPDAADVLRIEQELADDPLADPFDDPSLAELADLWRALRGVGEQVDPDQLAELLQQDLEPSPAPSPSPAPAG
jgi:hypothetical protein